MERHVLKLPVQWYQDSGPYLLQAKTSFQKTWEVFPVSIFTSVFPLTGYTVHRTQYTTKGQAKKYFTLKLRDCWSLHNSPRVPQTNFSRGNSWFSNIFNFLKKIWNFPFNYHLSPLPLKIIKLWNYLSRKGDYCHAFIYQNKQSCSITFSKE